MLRVFDGGIPDRVLGRGSAISLFLLSVHTQQFKKIKNKIKYSASSIKKPRLQTPAILTLS